MSEPKCSGCRTSCGLAHAGNSVYWCPHCLLKQRDAVLAKVREIKDRYPESFWKTQTGWFIRTVCDEILETQENPDA